MRVYVLHMIIITPCIKCAVREETTRMQWTWISVFILQALADKSTDETPNQQEDKMERNVSRKQKRLVMTDM